MLTPEEIVALIEQADALRHTRAHGREVFLRHPGDARSAHFGQGLDFEEVRAYQAGDDIRNMDWRTTARTGEPYLKVFREEHHPALHIVVDRGAGMRFGTTRQLKAAQAARVAILAAVLESSAFACVGGTILDKTAVTLPCLTKQAGILQLAQAAAAPCPPCLTDQAQEHQTWTDALRRIAATLPNGSRLLLCSDFRWLAADDTPLLAHLALRHDVACVHITDPVEHALPALGRASFYDLATQRLRWVDTGKREVRERFAQAAGARHKEIENRLRQLDIAYFTLGTGSDPMQLFLAGMDD
ncbi:MAG: hypothetical protein A2Z01_05030 [Betaproteobacteria bacterium RBG_16_58_11]|nr:MAG: hypothetical protein A2Z01_05030 [Betaproteobacteria bacterium RBG_16_58_11]